MAQNSTHPDGRRDPDAMTFNIGYRLATLHRVIEAAAIQADLERAQKAAESLR